MKISRVFCFFLLIVSILSLTACKDTSIPEEILGDWYLTQEDREYADSIPKFEPYILPFSLGPVIELQEISVVFSISPTTLTLRPGKYDNHSDVIFTGLEYRDGKLTSGTLELSYTLDTSKTPTELIMTGKDAEGNDVSFTLYSKTEYDELLNEMIESY